MKVAHGDVRLIPTGEVTRELMMENLCDDGNEGISTN